MHESLQMYTFLERKLCEKYNGDINFLPKILFFLENNKKQVLYPFSFETS